MDLWGQPLAAALLEAGIALLLADQWLSLLTPVRRRCLQVWLGLTLGLYLLLACRNMTQCDWATLPTALVSVLLHTHFGWAQCLALAAWLVLVLADPWPLARWAGVVGLLLSRAATGHAADAGFPSWALPMQMLHVGAVSLWLGSVLLASVYQARTRAEAAQLAQRLSVLATWSLGLIVLSGAWNAVQRLSQPLWPATTSYASWLVLKLALVALAILLGTLNRYGFLPACQRQNSRALTRFWRVLRLEAGVLLMALLLACRLASTMPG